MAFIADRLSPIKPSPTNAAQGKFLEMKAAGKEDRKSTRLNSSH